MRKRLRWIVPVAVMTAVFLLFRFVLFNWVCVFGVHGALHKVSYIVGSRVFGELKAGGITVFRRKGRLLVKRITTVERDIVMHNGKETEVPIRRLHKK